MKPIQSAALGNHLIKTVRDCLYLVTKIKRVAVWAEIEPYHLVLQQGTFHFAIQVDQEDEEKMTEIANFILLLCSVRFPDLEIDPLIISVTYPQQLSDNYDFLVRKEELKHGTLLDTDDTARLAHMPHIIPLVPTKETGTVKRKKKRLAV